MSATFTQIKPASLERAVTKARQIKPLVHVNGFNDFTVAGSQGNKYSVKFTGKGVDFTAHCTCTGSENGNACYHAAAAAPIFKQQVNERASARSIITFQGIAYDLAMTKSEELEILFDKVVDEASNQAEWFETGKSRITAEQYKALSDESTALWTAIDNELKTRPLCIECKFFHVESTIALCQSCVDTARFEAWAETGGW